MFRKLFTAKNERINMTMQSICDGHHRMTYRGVKALKCPFDYVIYQMLINEVKPDLVIEIGTNIGGGALYLADLLNNVGDGIVHTIDLIEQAAPVVSEHPRIKMFTEGWERYDISEAARYTKILVIDDASHLYEETFRSISKFAPLVTPGSYLIVEDGIVNELGMEKEYCGGPLKAIREFLESHEDFIIDRKWCDFFGENATFNVNGYLKKIR